jgi:hypothetical protein
VDKKIRAIGRFSLPPLEAEVLNVLADSLLRRGPYGRI